MPRITKHAIRVYAALDGLKGGDQDDAIDALLPFLIPILQVMRGTPFAPNLLVVGVRRLYGWTISQAVAETFRDRLLEKGYLKKKTINRSTVLFCEPPDDGALHPNEVAAATALERIIDDFEHFPERVSSLFHTRKSREDLKDILIRYLVSLDAYDAEGLFVGLRDAVPGMSPDNPLEIDEGGTPLQEEDRYLCAKFVTHLAATKSPHLDQLSRIASVGLLAELVTEFARPTGAIKRSSLFVLLDAPIALDLVGTSGPEAAAEVRQVIEALKSIGCTVGVLSDSCREITRVLGSLLGTPKQKRHGVTHSALAKGEVTEDYVRLVRDDPEGVLASFGIAVRAIDLEQYPAQHRFFPAEKYEDFLAGLGWYNDDAREHDARCVALVMRMRAGTQSRDPLACSYVFASSNSRLTKYAREFCLNAFMLQSSHCGPAVHFRELAAAAWLRTGLGVGEAIPRASMLAACEKVLRVRREVVDKARATIAKVCPERLDQYELLLQERRSVIRLMDNVLGNEEKITDEHVEQLLNDMHRALAQDIQEEYEKKLSKLRSEGRSAKRQLEAEYATQVSSRDAEIDRLSRLVTELSDRTDRLNTSLVNQEARETAVIRDIAERVNQESRLLDKSVFWLSAGIAAAVIVGSILEQMRLFEQPNILKWFAIPASALAMYHFIQDMREQPVRGLTLLRTLFVRWRFGRSIRAVGLAHRKEAKAACFRDGCVKL